MKILFVTTPFTSLRLGFSGGSLVEVDFDVKIPTDSQPENALFDSVREQIRAYTLSADYPLKVPLAPKGTAFQQRVWALLQKIPAGSVRTYGDIAAELGSSPRAVGNACRANPIPLFIPCHRVVSKSGLGGFAGKTRGHYLAIKKALLRHEGVEIPDNNPRCIGK